MEPLQIFTNVIQVGGGNEENFQFLTSVVNNLRLFLYFVALVPAGASSLQRHRPSSMSVHVRAVRSRGGLRGLQYLAAFQWYQARFWVVRPPVAKEGSKQLPQHHQFRVRLPHMLPGILHPD